MSSAFIGLLDDVKAQAREQIREIAIATQEGMTGPGGRAFGDVDISPDDRIARFVDMAETGLLDILEGMGAPVYWTLIREFVQDVMRSPLTRPVTMSPKVQQDIESVMGAR